MQFKDLDDSPDMIRPLVKMLEDHLPSTTHFIGWDAFNYSSFYQIVKGNGLLSNDLLKQKVLDNDVHGKHSADFFNYRRELKATADRTTNHKEFIIDLGGKINE
jgi:hypothetical protein